MVGEFDFVSAYNASGVLTTVYTPVGKAEQVQTGGADSGGAGIARGGDVQPGGSRVVVRILVE